MLDAGADALILHLGLITKSPFGAAVPKTIPEAAERLGPWLQQLRIPERDVFFLIHGGPVKARSDAEELIRKVPRLDGFYLI
jgi:predicted TIM-barrel enzyme